MAVALALAAPMAAAQSTSARAIERVAERNGDWIAAVVNQELVTAGEVDRRLQRAQAEASRRGVRLPAEAELRKQVLDALIDERAVVTTARESGVRVDEAEIDRAVQNIALQNQLTLPVLRERLAAEGMDYGRFRANLRDEIMVERLREREVYQRIRITDEEIEKYLGDRRAAAWADAEINIAQILVSVPEGASAAVLAEREQIVRRAQERLKAGESFEAVARELSEDSNRARGGEIGLRPVARLPDLFVEAVRKLKPGEVAPEAVRSGAGLHLLKLLARNEAAVDSITQTRARHVLLRTSAQLSAETAQARLAEYRRQIESGTARFEDIARQHSEDGSAPAGGDLGWAQPGQFVPEFEQAMNALPVGGLSVSVVSRFGVHLIQVVERRNVALEPKQLREQARNVLREQKFEQAYLDWTKELRSRAYVEFREPPL
jgi:peptidyl-prolyl cis-trans isomerase SurA